VGELTFFFWFFEFFSREDFDYRNGYSRKEWYISRRGTLLIGW
jgi:hypothetical protein